MLKIAHRINTSQQLINTPTQYGVEMDLRAQREHVFEFNLKENEANNIN